MALRPFLLFVPLSAALLHCSSTSFKSADKDPDASGVADDGSGGAGSDGGGGPGSGGSDTGGSNAGGSDRGGTGGDATGGSVGSGGTSDEDTTAPTIISITPSDGDVGVGADAPFVVEFSEPMHKANTQASYQSSDIPTGQVTFEWNQDATRLTIQPVEPLEYAHGKNAKTATAIEYSFDLSDAATDLAGNPLESGESVSFTTLRRVSRELLAIAKLTGHYGPLASSGNELEVGDNWQNYVVRGLITIDIASIDDDVHAFESAILLAEQHSTVAATYTSLGGQIDAYHVLFDSVSLTAATSEPLSSVGIFSTNSASAVKQINVLPQLSDDYDNRGERGDRSQYRLEFEDLTDHNDDKDQAEFHAPSISVTYLID
jgi:hypothetical protein